MTILVLRSLKGESARNTWCDIPGCRKSGAVKAEIMGWPAGRVCRAHAKEWRITWAAAAGILEEVAA